MTTAMKLLLTTLHHTRDFCRGDSPGEVTFEVCIDTGKFECQAFDRIALRFNVMLYEIGQALVLATRLNVSSTFEIEKMFPKWRAIRLLPANRDRIDNCSQFTGVIVPGLAA